jgi:hypothetical protein
VPPPVVNPLDVQIELLQRRVHQTDRLDLNCSEH